MGGLKRYISVGQNLELMIFGKRDAEESFLLPCSIYDIINDEEFIISAPIRGGALYPLRVGTAYPFRFYAKRSGMYVFKAVVHQRQYFDQLRSIRVRLCSKIERIQRRQFFRIDLVLEGQLLPIEARDSQRHSDAGQERRKAPQEVSFSTMDISGNGLKILTKVPIPLHSDVVGRFAFEEDEISFKGRILRSRQNDLGNYESGMMFTALSEADRTKLIAYVFEVESRVIKKGGSNEHSRFSG